MKQCQFCAEQILDEAIKCRYCGELLTTQSSTTQNDRPDDGSTSPIASLPIMFWIGALVGTVVLSSAAYGNFAVGGYASGLKAIIVTIAFAGLSPVVWRIADWLRRYAAPSAYFGSGFFDMVGKRFFWTYGPQLIALAGAAFLMSAYIENIKTLPTNVSKSVTSSVPSTVAATAIGNSSPAAEESQQPQLSEEEKQQALLIGAEVVKYGVNKFFLLLEDGGLDGVERFLNDSYKSYDSAPTLRDLQRIAAVDITAIFYYRDLSDNGKVNKSYDFWDADTFTSRVRERLVEYAGLEAGNMTFGWLQLVDPALEEYYKEHAVIQAAP